MSVGIATIDPFREGWENHQRLLVAAVGELTAEQLRLRAAPDLWTVWQLAAHVAGARAYWMHDVLGEGDDATRDMFRVARTTVPGLPLEDAGWEDDDDHPRAADELVDALTRTWATIEDCLRRWKSDDLAAPFPRPRRHGGAVVTRGRALWTLLEHDVHHGGAISLILGTHGLPGLDL